MVYGLRFWGQGAWIDIASDAGYLVVVPLCLFSIIDGRVSALWETKVDSEGDTALLPSSFHRKYYIDELVEGDSDTLRDFWCVRALLETEVPENLRAGIDTHS